MVETPRFAQAVTQSYNLRFVMHGVDTDDDQIRTLCGRVIIKMDAELEFSEDIDRACKKCVLSVRRQENFHPGFE